MIFIVTLRAIFPAVRACRRDHVGATHQLESGQARPALERNARWIAYETRGRTLCDLNIRPRTKPSEQLGSLPWPRDYRPISTAQPSSHLPSSTENGKR